MRPELSPRQKETLEWIKRFISQNGLPPTVREIGRAFGIKSSSTFAILKALQKKGYLRRTELGPRSLEIIGQKLPARSCDCIQVPIIGRIAAGCPVEAIEHDTGTLHVNRELLRGHGGFALKVVGDSMVETGILDGDYVVIRKQKTAENGDVVVALIDDEATLKRFYLDDDGVRLEPANSAMQPIHVRTGEFRIQGKLVGVQRYIDRNS